MMLGLLCRTACRTMTAMAIIASATPCAAADRGRSTIRLVTAESDVESGPRFTAGDDAAASAEPSPTGPTPTPLPPPVPEQLGSELLQPAPNPYQATSPEPYYAPQPPPDHFGSPQHHAPLRAAPRRIVEHYENRPRQLPLQQESWLNRPWATSFFMGGMFLDNPIPTLDGDPGFFFGGRFSWDFGPKWGTETRIGFAGPGVTSATSGGTALPQVDVFIWDLNWIYYPTGDTRWRPYLTAGFGLLDADYDDLTTKYHDTAFALPWGVGLKYRHSTRVALRFDVLDHLTFATGPQNLMHNLTVSAGFESRFGGGSRKNYWPWNPGRNWR